ncbi:GNAT family N-acetyltransferase [Alteromonas sp. SM 2104]|nr:GNAT family N-acetyltransferase [Alteromonas oceanisediminis]
MLKPFADADLLYRLDQDPEVMRFISGGKPTSWSDITTVFSPRLAAYINSAKGWGLWGCFSTDTEDFIGWVLVRPMGFFDEHKLFDSSQCLRDIDIELGWRFKRAAWGKGFATEAAAHIMKSLNDLHGYRQFSAVALPQNSASIAIMKKLGMRFISRGLHRDPLGDMQLDTYSIEH